MRTLFACRFRQITGLPCPSCGSTRAVASLLRLDVAQALRFSPITAVAALLLAARERGRFASDSRGRSSGPSLEAIVVAILAMGLLRAVLVAAGVRTPFTTPHIESARSDK